VDDVRQRLIRCFSAVFPELTTEQIVKVTSDDTRNWDSLNWVTLVAVIEEEFEIELDADCIAGGISFEDILKRVNDATLNRVPPEASRQ
jgi:acyl carrier protein